ncbi:MAG: Zn-dependent hydrolase [Desulfovibrio sp.]|jgi:N-carbamoyl-L-amino-acid hydrolase|nr:Zn-dependent hydrolase [Desulfovibrio sp.]
MHITSKERLQEKIAAWSAFGDAGHGGITRLSLSAPALQARAEFARRAKELGLTLETDDLGNMYATRSGSEKLPRIAMGSHMDSVVCGGNYDGILGVLTGLEVVETLAREKIPTRHPITAMVWTNEEGARFPPAMMCSGIVTGKFDKAAMMAVKDKEGVAFGEALEKSGYLGDLSKRLNPSDYAAYLELHIEQGPVLEDAGITLGVVEGVVGMCNYTIQTRGQSDHAGTTPMNKRQDALHAASQLICSLYVSLGAIDPDLVFTFGHIDCHPNVHTVIPDEVSFSLDARHRDPAVVGRVVEAIKALPREVVGCAVSFQEAWSRNTVPFHKPFVDLVQKNAEALGYSWKRMYSGPGHDAQYVQDMLPSTMIFVPSIRGHSHCEEEKTNLDDCWKGANVLLNTVLDIDRA